MGIEEANYEGAHDAFSRALEIARAEGDIALEMRTLASAGTVDYGHLRYRESLEKLLRAIELAQRLDDPLTEVDARFFVVVNLIYLGDSEEAWQHAQAGLSAAERLKDHYSLASALIVNGLLLYATGDWQAARDITHRGLALSPMDPRHLFVLAEREHETGERDQGESYLERLLELMRLAPSRSRTTAVSAYVAILIPLVARIIGVMDRLDVAETAAEAVLSSPYTTPVISFYARTGLGLIAVQRGDAAAAGKQYAALEPRRGTSLSATAISCDRLLGLLAQTVGKLDKAAEHFEEALAFCRRAGYRPELAWSLCDYADCLKVRNNSGDREKAMTLLDESLQISSELGMRPLMERVLSRREILRA